MGFQRCFDGRHEHLVIVCLTHVTATPDGNRVSRKILQSLDHCFAPVSPVPRRPGADEPSEGAAHESLGLPATVYPPSSCQQADIGVACRLRRLPKADLWCTSQDICTKNGALKFKGFSVAYARCITNP